MKLNLALTFFSVTLVAQLDALACPKLKPVPIDPDFLFKKQPNGGFYAPFAWGEDGIPSYTDKPTHQIPGAKQQLCVKTKLKYSGQEIFTGPPTECKYAGNPSRIYCQPKGGPGAAAAAAAAGMAAVGLKLPKVVEGTIVDTDNKTFLAWAACMDGALYQWNILTLNPNDKKIHAKTLKALHVTPQQVKESVGKKFKPGRSTIKKGPCPADSTAPFAEGLEGVQTGLDELVHADTASSGH